MLSTLVIASFMAAAANAQDVCDIQCILKKFTDGESTNQNSLGDLLKGLEGLDLGKLLGENGIDTSKLDFGELDFSKFDISELTKSLTGGDKASLASFCTSKCDLFDNTQFAEHKATCQAGCNNLDSLGALLSKQAEDAKIPLDQLRNKLKDLSDGDAGDLNALRDQFTKFASEFLTGKQFSEEQKALAAQFGLNIDDLRNKALGVLTQLDNDPNAVKNAAANLRSGLLGAVGSDELVDKVQKQLAQLNLADDQQAIVIQIAQAVESSLTDVKDAVAQYGGVIDEIDQLIQQRKRQDADERAAAPERKNFVVVAPMPRIGTDISIADLSDLLATVDGTVSILGVVTKPTVEQLGVLNQQVFDEKQVKDVEEDTASMITLASVVAVSAIALLF